MALAPVANIDFLGFAIQASDPSAPAASKVKIYFKAGPILYMMDSASTVTAIGGTTLWQPLDADLTTWAGITPGANVGTFLATPSSANLAAAVTGETGSGALVFGTSPTLVTPALGTPSALVLTNATGLPTAGLVANAVTQNAFDSDAPVTTNSTTSTSYADTNLSVTLTTTGGDVLVMAMLNLYINGSYLYPALQLDSDTEIPFAAVNTPPGVDNVCCLWRFTGVSAASHTIKIRWKVSAGTGYMYGALGGNTLLNSLTVVELKR